MAGIYIHIPFCKSRCKYCDFFSTTMMEKREEYTHALVREIEQRCDYLPSKQISTIYFGGGTPSLMEEKQLEMVLQTIRSKYDVEADAEITLEANPGDLTEEKLLVLHQIGFNRLSIGIQSFHDEMLKTIGRRHTSEQAISAVSMARKVGFNNISIDLIYGLPGQSLDEWQQEVEQAIALHVEHISAYCLSYEEGTVLTKMLKKGVIQEVDEDIENQMYDYLVSTLEMSGICRYEVSNFCKRNHHSRHNSSYWSNTPYLGLGAGAHSYNGTSRQWNFSDLDAYLKAVNMNGTYFDREELSEDDIYNETIMLSLRTKWGIDLAKLSKRQLQICQTAAQPYIEKKLLIQNDNHIIATQQGIHILNRIIEDLMI